MRRDPPGDGRPEGGHVRARVGNTGGGSTRRFRIRPYEARVKAERDWGWAVSSLAFGYPSPRSAVSRLLTTYWKDGLRADGSWNRELGNGGACSEARAGDAELCLRCGCSLCESRNARRRVWSWSVPASRPCITSQPCVGREETRKKGLGCQARRLRLRRRLAPGSEVPGSEARWASSEKGAARCVVASRG